MKPEVSASGGRGSNLEPASSARKLIISSEFGARMRLRPDVHGLHVHALARLDDAFVRRAPTRARPS